MQHDRHTVEIGDLITCCRRWRLRRLEVVFLDDALVGLALALDAILELALPLRKQRENLVKPRDCIAPAYEANHAPDRKAMAGGCILMFSHAQNQPMRRAATNAKAQHTGATSKGNVTAMSSCFSRNYLEAAR